MDFRFDTFGEREIKHSGEDRERGMCACVHVYVCHFAYSFRMCMCMRMRFTYHGELREPSLVESQIHLNSMKTYTTRVYYAFANINAIVSLLNTRMFNVIYHTLLKFLAIWISQSLSLSLSQSHSNSWYMCKYTQTRTHTHTHTYTQNRALSCFIL